MLTAAAASLITASSVVLAKGPVQGFVLDGYFIPGEGVSARELLRVSSPLFMRRAPYFAFLENRDDARINFGWPSPRLTKPILLGQVDLRPFRYRGERRVEARLSFQVPDLSPGLYDVVICDMGCDHEVKRLGPSGLYVVSSGTERRLRNEIDSLYSELSRWENRVVRLSGQGPNRSEERWRVLQADLATLEEEVDTLRRQVAQAKQPTGFSLPWRNLAIIGVPVTAIAGLLLGRAMRSPVAASRSLRGQAHDDPTKNPRDDRKCRTTTMSDDQ